MRHVGWVSGKVSLILTLLFLAGCNSLSSPPPIRKVDIQQNWELQPGESIAGRQIVGSLGDVSVELKGGRIYAPFDGLVEPNDVGGCVIFSSPDVPAYLFRLCGLRQPRLGQIRQGETIGSGSYVHFAALRRQPDGNWTMVEPAQGILERSLTPQR